MRDGRGLVRAVLLGILLVALVAPPASAYLGQTKKSVTVTAEAAVVKCGKSVKLTATVLNTRTNSPVRNETVRWEIKSSPSRNDRLSDSSTRTNSQGKTTVTLRLDDKTGTRVIKAKVDGASGTTTISCKKDDRGHKPKPPKLHWWKVPKSHWVPVRDYGPFWLRLCKGWR